MYKTISKALLKKNLILRRIAMVILGIVGISPRLLMLGFMIPTAFLSMWIRYEFDLLSGIKGWNNIIKVIV